MSHNLFLVAIHYRKMNTSLAESVKRAELRAIGDPVQRVQLRYQTSMLVY